MCKLKSAIILKDRIFMPDYDSHSEMLDELGITDDYFNAVLNLKTHYVARQDMRKEDEGKWQKY